MHVPSRGPLRAAGLLALAASLFAADVAFRAAPASAQYFGRNNVQYESFDFQVLKTEHFDVYFYPSEERAARDVARMAERWYARLSQVLDWQFEERQALIVYANADDFRQTAITSVGEGTLGVTDFLKRRIALYVQESYEETDHLVGHELVHAFQFDIAGIGDSPAGLEAAARRFQVPLWFVEGMAEYLSGGPVDPNAAMVLRDAALSGRIPTIDQLGRDGRYFPYTWGHGFWAYVSGVWGDAVIGQILKQVGAGVPYQLAFQRILNAPLDEVGKEWSESIRQAYLPLLTEQREAQEIARTLITEETEGGRLNLGPSLSPDGTRVAFLSSRSNLEVALYVADAQTGEVIRTLQKGTTFDPHFDALNFINSAGTWSPDGERFAISAARGGTGVVVILDALRGGREREYRIEDVEGIATPTWSPDGRTIVFSGMQGGYSDLYALELETGQIRRLTDDPYADLHPAFSPDGSTVAFVSDRGPGGTDLASLRFGTYQVALLDVATGAVRFLPRMEGEKNINPVWARDGRSIFFVSNRTGIPNVYRLFLGDGRLTQVTNLFAGVSGITELSPVLAISRDSDRLLFTAYEETGYNIYALDDAPRLAGVPVPEIRIAENLAAPLPAILPPLPRPVQPAFNRVATLVADPDFGLPPVNPDTAYAVRPYRPTLSLDYVGQPQLGFTTGGGYSRGGVYGGINGIFTDELGYHTVYAAVVAQGQLDEIGGLVQYINQKSRWNWGAAVQRLPYIYPFLAQGFSEDRTSFIREIQYYRIFDSGLRGLLQYPFSTVQRAEFSAGARRISRDVQVDRFIYDAATGALIDRDDRSEDLDAYNLGEASAALVFDNSLRGYTSPFAGQRYRFELSPTFGDINYYQALADFRRYFFLRPFTFAVRGMHIGRYGQDAEDQTLLTRPLVLGQPYFIRGYDIYDVADDCREALDSECGLFDQLYGSRVGVANAEIRYPLLNAVGSGGRSGLPPVELLAFADAGVAWEKGVSPVFGRGIQEDPAESGFLTSAGVGARINLFGYLIAEVDYLRAFERDDGWRWQFSLLPGF